MTQKLHTTDRNARVAFYPGSFNPFTVGHASIVERGLAIFDRVIIGVGINVDKDDAADIDSRMQSIRQLYADNQRVSVVSYSGLTAPAAIDNGATALLRGVRGIIDFEYEHNMADVNRKISGIDTVILTTLPEFATISSSLVRELRHFGRNVDDMLPTPPSSAK